MKGTASLTGIDNACTCGYYINGTYSPALEDVSESREEESGGIRGIGLILGQMFMINLHGRPFCG